MSRIPVTRRTFLRRAGMLVSSLGVAGGVQSGLMDSILRKANKRWGGEALAAEPGAVNFVVEILFRAGFQFNALFPSRGHMTDARNGDLNFYSSQANVVPVTVGDRTVYFARYAAGDGADRLATNPLITSGRVGVATSEVIDQGDGQHTGNFYTRAPNTNAPCPACLHASLANPADVQGIEWNSGVETENQRGGQPALNRVRNRNELLSLFREVPMFFTREELQLVVGEIEKGAIVNGRNGTVGRLDELFLVKNIRGASDFSQVQLAGRGQAQLSLANQLVLDDVAGNFTELDREMGGARLSQALGSAAKAFASGATTTFTISLESEDWHGDIPNLDDPNGKQGMWNSYVGNAIDGFLRSMEQLPNPFDPSKRLVDSFLLSLSSEFTRTPLRLGGSDNGDGGTQAFCFIGSKVRTGSYGNIRGSGEVRSFDPQTGLEASADVGSGMVWKTAGKLMGLSDATLNAYVPQSVPAISALVRP